MKCHYFTKTRLGTNIGKENSKSEVPFSQALPRATMRLVRKSRLFAPFYTKVILYQDRLGATIGQNSKKDVILRQPGGLRRKLAT
jgi:hypothetical protein